MSQKLASCNTAAVEDDQPGEDQSDPLADPEVPDNANHQQPQPTGGDEAQEDGSEIPASNNSLNINAAEGSEAEDPFLRPTHEVRRERKIARAKERTSYSKMVASNADNSKNRRNNSAVTGQATGTGLRSAPAPNRDFFVYRVHKDDGLDKIKIFLQSKRIKYRNVELTSHASSKFNSFKVAVDVNDTKTITDPNFWEKGICIRRWYIRESRK